MESGRGASLYLSQPDSALHSSCDVLDMTEIVTGSQDRDNVTIQFSQPQPLSRKRVMEVKDYE